MDINSIVKEIKKYNNFDLNTYYTMIKKYGKKACKEAFELFLQKSRDKNNTFNKFFDAYFSFEIDEMKIDADSYLLLVQKYSEDTINDYFKRLLLVKDIDQTTIKIKFADIYQYVDVDDVNVSKCSDDFYSDDSITMYIVEIGNFKQFTPCEEREQFIILNDARENIKIATIDDNGSLSFNNITNIIYSISCVEQIMLLSKIRKYINGKDKELIDKYIKLWKKLNKDNEEKNILPNISEIEIDLSNHDIIESDYLVKQLEYILTYNKTRELIINSNLRLIVYNAKKYFNKTIDFSPLDLIQAGNLGLIRAVEKFDVSKGYKFSTYATWWINQEITRELANSSRSIRVPVNIQEKIRRMDKTGKIEDIPYTWNESHVEYLRGLIYGNSYTSLNLPIDDDSEYTVQDSVPSLEKTPEEKIADFECKKNITEALSTLTDKERFVIIHRFGLYDNEILTLEDIGKIINVTRERIRQIEAKAIRKLGKPSRGRKLVDFCENPDFYDNIDENGKNFGKIKTKRL